MSTRAVLDASPLIAFHQIGKRHLIHMLFDEAVAPPEVAREVSPSVGQLPSWLRVPDPVADSLRMPTLDAGEREAIAIAFQTAANVIVLDDRTARIQAMRLGLSVTGSAGLLVLARRREFVEAVKPDLDAMISHGLYMSAGVYQEVLRAAGEDASR